MRILCWNVNGWKKIKTYQPWSLLTEWSRILNHLEADVICLQETKLTRKQAVIDRQMCLPSPKWESFWDFHPSRGYSGTVIYVNKETVGLPVTAELGVTGRKTTASDKKIGGQPKECKLDLEDDLYTSLDEEGRSTIVDLGFFVLFNLYCPVGGSEDRRDFRMAFYACVNERARNLLEQGRNVIIVGDINIARQPIDHCDFVKQEPDAMSEKVKAEFYDESPARQWLNDFLQPRGPFLDAAREAHPDRTGMYTCWSTLINARPSNYGTRIDYTLVSPGLKDWIKTADIQAHVPGSDHCPVFVDLLDERVIEGKTVKLKDLLSNAENPSSIAASRWDEFRGKDLKSFFAKAKAPSTNGSIDGRGVSSPSPVASPSKGPTVWQPPPRPSEPAPSASLTKNSKPTAAKSTTATVPSKSKNKALAPKARQQKLGAFFGASNGDSGSVSPGKSVGRRQSLDNEANGAAAFAQALMGNSSSSNIVNDEASQSATASSSKLTASPTASSSRTASPMKQRVDDPESIVSQAEDIDNDDEIVDWDFLQSLPDEGSSSSSTTNKTASSAWSSIFQAPPPPNCPAHNLPAKSYSVTKRSLPSFGRKFWLCAQPVGVGWEKKWSTSKSARERELEGSKEGFGPEGEMVRCGYFKWNSDWEREWRKRKETSGGGKEGDGKKRKT